MTVAIELDQNFIKLSPQTERLDGEAGAELFELMKNQMQMHQCPNFIIDLSAVQHLLIEAVQPLLASQEMLLQQSGTLVLTNTQEPVLQKIKQERLHLSIQVANNMEEVLELLRRNEEILGDC